MAADAKPLSPVQSPFAEQVQGGLPPNNQPPKATSTKTESSLRTTFGKLLGIIPLGIGLLIVGLGISLAIGAALAKLSPARMVTVQQFEISSEIANRVSVSGKTASDIVVDTLNNTASKAQAYQGTDYYNWGSTGSQPLALRQSLTTPLQATYDIDISGISLESLMQL